jgi:hypothetical protein
MGDHVPDGGRSTVRSRRLGAALLKYREAAELVQKDAAAAVKGTTTKISRMETGKVSVRLLELSILLDLYGVHDPAERARLEGLARDSGRRGGWWTDYGDTTGPGYADHISMENDATHISEWTGLIIPGLCQHPSYAQKAIENGSNFVPPERITELVMVRRQRQERILNDGVYYAAVIWEPLITTPAWGNDVHVAQLEHLANMATRQNVTIQVLPGKAIAVAGLAGQFSAFSFNREPGIEAVALSNITNTTVLEEAEELSSYSRTFDRLRSDALSKDESLALIRHNIEGKGPKR